MRNKRKGQPVQVSDWYCHRIPLGHSENIAKNIVLGRMERVNNVRQKFWRNKWHTVCYNTNSDKLFSVIQCQIRYDRAYPAIIISLMFSSSYVSIQTSVFVVWKREITALVSERVVEAILNKHPWSVNMYNYGNQQINQSLSVYCQGQVNGFTLPLPLLMLSLCYAFNHSL